MEIETASGDSATNPSVRNLFVKVPVDTSYFSAEELAYMEKELAVQTQLSLYRIIDKIAADRD